MQQPLERSQLDAIFRRAERPRAKHLIGLEQEKVSYRLEDGGPVPYGGPRGIHRLLLELCARFDWQPEHTEGYLLSLARGRAHITLEPGGQLELSGSPWPTVAECEQELAGHLREALEVGRALGIGFSTLGMHPARDPRDIEFIPKPRYRVMRRYFQTSGTRGLYMMGATATTQVNLDFSSEAEAMEKMRAAQLASPYISALFGNSPFEHGRLTPYASRRYFTWLDVDGKRQGMLDALYHPDASYADYIRWALAAPMFGVHRDGEFRPMPPLPFSEYLDHGFGALDPITEDWFDHLGTLYPEVRLKRTIELRGQDSGNLEHSTAIAALWRGLIDDPTARRKLIDLLPVPRDWRAFVHAVAKDGLRATDADGASALEVAHTLAKIAHSGLRALDEPAADSALEPVWVALDEGLSPADLLRKQLSGQHDAQLLFATAY